MTQQRSLCYFVEISERLNNVTQWRSVKRQRKAGSSEEKSHCILTERFLMLMPSNLLLHTTQDGHTNSCAMAAAFARDTETQP